MRARSARRPDAARPARSGSLAPLAGLAVVAAALGPIAAELLPYLPFTVVPVVVPQWFATEAPRLPPGQVVLAFPPPFAFRQSAMTWQAVAGMGFAQVGGGGPGSLLARAGPEREGQAYLTNIAYSATDQTVVPKEVGAVRRALDGWGVTVAVLPDPGPLPEYARVDTARPIVVLMTAAVGRMPVHRAGAWVWPDIARAGPPARPTAEALVRCGGPSGGSVASLRASAACVLAASTG